MRRRYNTQLYRERIDLIKKLMPNACIGADVIVGFPGETDQEFKKTLDFLIELPLSYLHVFTYSERANTTATRMNDVVPVSIRKQRSKQLRNLSEKKKRAFYISQQGANEKVVFEKQEENGVMFGFTSNYIKVKTGYNPYMINQTGHVKLTEVGADGIMKMIFTKQEKEQKLIHEIKIDK
jgi:threonylcarbamoyladenosine tRNA methylthiotransferase MtaB